MNRRWGRSPSVPTHQDPGLQPERTALAWNRTALALTVVAMTLLRWLGMFSQGVVSLVLVALAGALFISLTQRHRYHEFVAGIAVEHIEPNTAAVLVLSLTAVMIGVVAMVLMLL